MIPESIFTAFGILWFFICFFCFTTCVIYWALIGFRVTFTLVKHVRQGHVVEDVVRAEVQEVKADE